MHFQQLGKAAYRPFTSYLLALATISLAYVLGNLPFAFVSADFHSSGISGEQLIDLTEERFGKTNTLVLLMCPWIFVFFSFFPIAKFILRWPILSLFTSREKFDWRRFLIGFTLWFSLTLILFVVQFNENLIWQWNWSLFIPLFFISAIVLFLQSTAEELLFRSFLFKWMSQTQMHVVIQLLFSGFIFGYLHASNPEVNALGKIALLYYIGTGIFLGLVSFLDRGLELTMGFHFANNFFAAIIVTSNWQVFQTDALFLDMNTPSFGVMEICTQLISQLLFLVACWKVFKWKLSFIK